jgi:hypothetical protein
MRAVIDRYSTTSNDRESSTKKNQIIAAINEVSENGSHFETAHDLELLEPLERLEQYSPTRLPYRQRHHSQDHCRRGD